MTLGGLSSIRSSTTNSSSSGAESRPRCTRSGTLKTTRSSQGAPRSAHGTVGGGGCHKCHGNGCCMAAITSFYPSYIVRTRGLDLDVQDVDPSIQNLVIIGETDWTQQAWCRMIGGKHGVAPKAGAQQQALPPDLSMVPVVVEWAMNSTPAASTDNTTARCHKDGASSVCKSNYSSCQEVHSPFHRGYACRCLPGYYGNPYLTDGCQDIDECADPEHHRCYGECTNMPGTFECRFGTVIISAGLKFRTGIDIDYQCRLQTTNRH
ncbi:hypothetical protein BAE44_0023434 [Dichanthelium oligosanthes]|uniref:EGF-like calcium-binding domain-containing protein n=1 Tax=Dichanthelium oligosanthes TaxID=888268 RepID=A0A1E5URN4_9POAL|nr:hypothetical protein BAE44_0023434 [Dichanthelium oligosanthes]